MEFAIFWALASIRRLLKPRERKCEELGHSWGVGFVTIRWRQRVGRRAKDWEAHEATGRTMICRRCKRAPLSHEAFELAVLKANNPKTPEADWPIIERTDDSDGYETSVYVAARDRGGEAHPALV